MTHCDPPPPLWKILATPLGWDADPLSDRSRLTTNLMINLDKNVSLWNAHQQQQQQQQGLFELH